MTAPQHNAQPKANQAKANQAKVNRKERSADKAQRCSFLALGLLGGFGFLASQVSFARAEGDFLIDDYAPSASSAVSVPSYSVADTTFLVPAPAFEAAQPQPDAWVDAPPAPTVASEAFTANAAPAYVPPAPAVHVPAPAPAITIEIQPATPAASVRPQVTPVSPPTFASVRKPTVTKTAYRQNPLAGLIEAGALAAPLSAYVSSQSAATLGIAEMVNNRSGRLVALNEADAGASAGSERIEAAPVPEIYPPEAAPPEPAAPPVVDIAPVEQAEPIQATELVPAALPEGTNLPDEYNSVFVDPTDYSVGATEPANAAPSIVVSEQSTGCQFTVGNGQAVPNGVCGTGSGASSGSAAQPEYAQAPANAGGSSYSEQVRAQAPAVNIGPVSFSASGIRFNNATTAAGRDYLNRSVRPLVNLQAAQQFIFPLAIPSPITSLFGFRIHPITGDQRFHAGTDIGAEQGTPVLAAQSGIVVSADYAGGYGLMVELEHKVEDTELRSRYAHLSEIFVEPGIKVNKGDVIGLVGSTGNSTGPHLHFEMMQNTPGGWVVVNPDSLVQNSLANLVRALNNPMQAMSFNLSDFNLNLSSIKKTPVPATPGSQLQLPPLPGQNGVSFRPAQPNAS